MIKSIFYKMITNSDQREEFSALDDPHDIYEFFCQKGYREDYETFEEEMREFLDSSEAQKIVSDFGSFTLTNEMLDMVAGGQGGGEGSLRRILVENVTELNKNFPQKK